MSDSDLVFWASQPTSVFGIIETQRRPHECGRFMSYLVHPDSPGRSVYDYVVALKDRLQERNAMIGMNPTRVGHNAFEKIVIDAGIIETFFQIAQDKRKDMERVFTAYFAAEALWELIVIGTVAERRALLQRFLTLGIDEFCVQNAQSAPFIVHRLVVMNGLRILTSQCFLAEQLSIEKVSEIMKMCCECILAGPDLWVKQLEDPATTWQSMFCFGSVGSPTYKAGRYAPRYYSLYQEHATWAVIELALRYPIPEQEHYNSLIKHDPEVLDLIFKCAKMKREAWYPQLEVDVRMSETLVLLVNFPADMVPGVELRVDDDEIQKRLERRWEGVMEGIELIASRPRCVQMVADVWKHIDDEDVDVVNMMLMSAQKDYFAAEPYKVEDLPGVLSYRGLCRIAILRLVTTIAFASERPKTKISDVDLLNLLKISQAACQVVKPQTAFGRGRMLKSSAEALERHEFCLHKPGHADPTMYTGKEDAILQISEEVMTGPTCHFRILVALAKRGLFEKVQQWDTLPEGLVVPGGLAGLRKMITEKEIRRCIALALERISDRRELGNITFREDRQMDTARFEFWSAAQLAAAVVQFDEATNGRYHEHVQGARKELALNLGNAAEMSLGEGLFDRALVFASASVRLAEAGFSSEDAVDEAVREKNQRRVDRARAGIQSKRA